MGQIIDFILHIDVYLSDIIAQYGAWTLAILASIIFVETGVVVMLSLIHISEPTRPY